MCHNVQTRRTRAVHRTAHRAAVAEPKASTEGGRPEVLIRALANQHEWERPEKRKSEKTYIEVSVAIASFPSLHNPTLFLPLCLAK